MAKIIFKAICSQCKSEIKEPIKVTQYTDKNTGSGYIEIKPFNCKNCGADFGSVVLPFKEEILDV